MKPRCALGVRGWDCGQPGHGEQGEAEVRSDSQAAGRTALGETGKGQTGGKMRCSVLLHCILGAGPEGRKPEELRPPLDPPTY